MIRLVILLLLMCENVNAAPQVPQLKVSGETGKFDAMLWRASSSSPAVAAPFMLLLKKGGADESDSQRSRGQLSDLRNAVTGAAHPNNATFTIGHPLCQTGFTIAQRYDQRNAAGAIIKSVWVRKCTNGRIVYGRKV